jgi:GAF domain-containing protein
LDHHHLPPLPSHPRPDISFLEDEWVGIAIGRKRWLEAVGGQRRRRKREGLHQSIHGRITLKKKKEERQEREQGLESAQARIGRERTEEDGKRNERVGVGGRFKT